MLLNSCSKQATPQVAVFPKHFKVHTPFIIDSRGIIINTYWGRNKKHYVLCIDNYSPSWIKSSVAQYNSYFVKSKEVSFKTSTADGTEIEGDVGICDSLSFENITFTNVPFYVIPDEDKNTDNDEGAFGIEVLSKGVWKINFSNSELTVASSIDSFPEKSRSEILPASFSEQSITIDVDFGEGIVKKMPVDIGYNGDMLIPFTEFKKLDKYSEVLVNPRKFSTPGHESMASSLSFFDTVTINHNYFLTLISSGETVRERLLGLTFFRRFNYVIFDFIDKKIYVPKKVW